MKTRILSALVGLSVLLLCMSIAPLSRVLFFAGVAVCCTYEFSRGMENIRIYCCAWVMYLYIAIQALLCLLHAGPVAFLVCFCGAVYLALFSGVLHAKVSGSGSLATLAGVAYLGFLLGLIMVISVGEYWRESLLMGLVPSLVCDCFAFFGGTLFGRHKLAPAISPKKTVEGALSGAVMGTLSGLGLYFLFPALGIEGLGLPFCLLAAFFSSTMGQVGDLAASLMKRFLNIKDFSNLIPGHGGMLDRADSLLFAIPAAYLCIALLRLL